MPQKLVVRVPSCDKYQSFFVSDTYTTDNTKSGVCHHSKVRTSDWPIQVLAACLTFSLFTDPYRSDSGLDVCGDVSEYYVHPSVLSFPTFFCCDALNAIRNNSVFSSSFYCCTRRVRISIVLLLACLFCLMMIALSRCTL